MTDDDGSQCGAALAIVDRLRSLRRFTPARIALGRTGSGQPTEANLQFMLDHARARDAVHAAADFDAIGRALQARDWSAVRVHSAALDRAAYLRRPDLGRRLSPDSCAIVADRKRVCDVAIVAADGLSALAINSGLIPLLDHLRPLLLARSLAIGPLFLVDQGRVAIGDEIGERIGAKLVVVLIGERPGLSAADSLGAYITWRPKVGSMDSDRNCISNIRTAGLSFEDAAAQISDLVGLAFAHRITGVRLNELRSAATDVGRGERSQLGRKE
jgi:ethanolamine ammonia-lyase small subunit